MFLIFVRERYEKLFCNKDVEILFQLATRKISAGKQLCLGYSTVSGLQNSGHDVRPAPVFHALKDCLMI